MDRKVLAILLILLMGAAFLTLGCAGKKNIGGEAPTATPAATAGAEPSATSHVSAAPATGGMPPETAAPASGGGSSGMSGLDPSLVDISGEDIDGGSSSDIDTGLPTPTISL